MQSETRSTGRSPGTYTVCESGPRAGCDGYKRRKGSKVQRAVDTLGHLTDLTNLTNLTNLTDLTDLTVTPANEQQRTQVKQLCEAVQAATAQAVQMAWADHGYTGNAARHDAQAAGIELRMFKPPQAGQGFVLLPLRSVVEWCSFGGLSRFWRL